MPLPTHQEIKAPLLTLLKRRKEVSLVEALDFIAAKFELSRRVTKKMQDCKKETVLQNRLRWARWEMQRDGLVKTTRRGFFALA